MKKFSKIIGIGIGVVAALVISASTTQAQNLLVNSGFETSPAGFTANPITMATVGQGWATFGNSGQNDMSSSADSPYAGSFALLEVNAAGNGWNPAGAYQILTASAGIQYSASIYALTDTGVQGDWWGTPAILSMTFLDSSFTTNGLSNGPSGGYSTGWTAITPNDTWQYLTTGGVAPTGTAYIGIYAMNMVSGANLGPVNVYFDNASLTVVPEPATLALLSMGLAVPFYFIRRRKS